MAETDAIREPAAAGVPEGAPAQPALLEARGVSKSFGAVRALSEVDFDVRAGEVHALAGANGAGKSTLIKIFAGGQQPDAGEIRVDGEPVRISHPDVARDAGLSFIHQDLLLVPSFTAAENMYLGRSYPRRRGVISQSEIQATVESAARELGIDFPLDVRVDELTLAQQWQVAICRSLVAGARVIFMDEPTAAFGAREADLMFERIDTLRRSGRSVVFVSHRVDEVLTVSDRVTVLRNGEVAASRDTSTLDRDALLELIAGRVLAKSVEAHADGNGARGAGEAPALRAVGLHGLELPHSVSFEVHRGEVLGLAGLVGSGRSETLHAIFGAAPLARDGELEVGGEPYRPRTPADAQRAGIVLLPEDRRGEGLVMGFSIAENATLPHLRDIRRWPWAPIISRRKEREVGRALIEELGVKASGPGQSVAMLSGGNQQKVALGKWLRLRPRVVLLDEPTKGVDVGGKEEIHSLVRALARGGAAVVVVSSELEELVALADRHVVLRDGRSVGELPGHATLEELVQASVGGKRDEQ